MTQIQVKDRLYLSKTALNFQYPNADYFMKLLCNRPRKATYTTSVMCDHS